MSSFQHTKYEHLQYSTNGVAQSWPDGYGNRKGIGAGYGNSSAYSFGGGYGAGGHDYYGSDNMAASGQFFSSGGNLATAGGGQFFPGGYGSDNGYSFGGPSGGYGGGYGSYGGHMTRSGGSGAEYRIHQDKARMMTSNTVVEGVGGSDLISALVPTSFLPGTDPKFIECFNRIDRDRNGSICDEELQTALSTFNQRFSLRTVHLLMYLFTGSSANAVGPREFVPLVRCLQTWKASFEMYDRNRNGSMDEMELKEAMMSMGYNLSPFVLKLLVSTFHKLGTKSGIEYDYFIECCLVIKGLTEKFKTKEDPYTGTATFTYDEFLLSVLPFVVMN